MNNVFLILTGKLVEIGHTRTFRNPKKYLEENFMKIKPLHDRIIVKRLDAENIYLQNQGALPINCFFHVYAERKDVDKLTVEYEGEKRIP